MSNAISRPIPDRAAWLRAMRREDEVRESHGAALAAGLPVVDGEVLWGDGEDAYYHFYPAIEQVQAWMAETGFAIVEEAEGPWHEDGYTYHHVLARRQEAAGSGDALQQRAGEVGEHLRER